MSIGGTQVLFFKSLELYTFVGEGLKLYRQAEPLDFIIFVFYTNPDKYITKTHV